MKSIPTINPAIKENTVYLIVEACTSFINLNVGVSLNHGASLHFILRIVLRTCWTTFQAKNNVRSAPASSALILVSDRNHDARIANRHLCDSG